MIGASARLRWSQTAHALAPLLFGIPVLAGIAVTFVRALGVSHPDLGFTAAINGDAEALYLGQTIYQDPADGYTGQLYTPLFPFLVSLLHHVTLWGGWVLLVNFLATFVLMGLVALARVRRRDDRGRAAAPAGGGRRAGRAGLVARERAPAEPALRRPLGPHGLGVRVLRAVPAGTRDGRARGARWLSPRCS